MNQAIARAKALALSTRKQDGSWSFPADVGPVSTAQALIALERCDLLPSDLRGKLGRFLVSQQREDGSFLRHVQAEHGDPATTSVCAAALERAGYPEAAARAFAYVHKNGGFEAIVQGLTSGELAAAFLVVTGHLPASILGRHGVEVFALPFFEEQFLRRYHAGVLMVFAQLAFLARGADPEGPLMRPALANIIRLCADFQNDDGSYNTLTLPTALAACAWMALGTTEGRERGRKAAGWLLGQVDQDAETARIYGFHLPLWSTVFLLRALLAAGEPIANLLPSVEWLCDVQHQRPQQWRNHPGSEVLSGGWSFDPGNHTMPDNDDTGAVLAVLREVQGILPADHPLQSRIRLAQERALAWLLAMQNPDGGWASYTHGLPGKPPGPILDRSLQPGTSLLSWLRLWTSPPFHLGDPSTEDVTARVLHGLGPLLPEASRQRALQFLQRQQCPDGSFWGRWLINYLACTSFVLMATKGIQAPWIQRAIDWVMERQNPDGSWGETPASYKDPSLAGKGPGMAPLTGLVLSGLVAAGQGESIAARKALKFLLERQQPDGGWAEDGWVTPLLLPDTFYAHPQASLYYPLEAIARMKQLQGQEKNLLDEDRDV